MRSSISGHLWTLAPHLAHAIRPERCPRDEPWETFVDDPDVGQVRLTGWVRHRPHADAIVVLVHGLGGSADSRYLLRAAQYCDALGLPYLRLSLRGADRSGEDLYHAGQYADLEAAVQSAPLARYRKVYLLGYSMGGHVALRWASSPSLSPKLKAVVCVCSPLDLSLGARSIQRPSGRPYQRYVLGRLKDIFRAAAHRLDLGISLPEVMQLKTITEWDDRVIVPRFGFESRHDYYEQVSAGPGLSRVTVPVLFIAADGDPMVTRDQLIPWLRETPPSMHVAWSERGGHLAFPASVDLGLGSTGPVEAQALQWAQRQ